VAIAFFDLDLTLLSLNSGAIWIRREARAMGLSPWRLLRVAYYLVQYQFGRTGLAGAIREAIATLKGTHSRDLRERAAAFYELHLRAAYRPGGLRRLAEHKARGDRVVLLTSTMVYLAEIVARDLGFDAILSNRFEVDEAGVHTGRSEGGLCFGPGKLDYAAAYAASLGVPLSECVFYTDSYTDLPVLEKVGRPVVVNPDRRLRRTASRRGWEIVDWGRP
jgi:HAD superfamily hydrolase (TIGR01490 family)